MRSSFRFSLMPVFTAVLLGLMFGGEVAAVPVLVESSQGAPRLRAAGAKVLAEYDGYSVVEWAGAGAPPVGEVMEGWTRIHLNTGTIDTTSEDAKKAGAKFLESPRNGLFLVQLAGPPRSEWHDALQKAGARVVEYIPDNTYLVYGSGAAAKAVSRMSASQAPVRWVGPMKPEWKIQPSVALPSRTGKAALNVIATDRIGIQLVDDPTANKGTLNLLQAALRSPVLQDYTLGGQRTVVAHLDSSLIESLAKQADVVSIQALPVPKKNDERQNRVITGEVLPGTAQPNGPGHMAWLANNGFTQATVDATGIVVDVTDSGIDNGTQTPNHFALRRGGLIGGASRVAYNIRFGTPNTGSTLAGCDGHGNINAHIVGGFTDAAANTAVHRDGASYQYGMGVNPFVRVGSSVIFDPANFTNPDYTSLASTAYQNGARVSNNSWGADAGGAYNSDSRAYDFLVRDSQPAGASFTAAGNQELTFVFSAGNAGSGGANTIGSPGTGKNVITVGAQENNHPFGGADQCGTTDAQADNPEDTATFSSRGPTDDGRTKPDITAPGTHITGGVYQASALDGANAGVSGTSAACFAAEGVCAGPGTSNFFPVGGQQFYTASSGTSHSSPGVVGVVSLIYDWYNRRYGSLPSPAMSKALLANHARYLRGAGTGDNLPSNSQGMGMADMGGIIQSGTRLVRDQRPEDVFTASLQQRVFTGRVADATKPLRITMAYTDAPGPTTGNSFVNQLSLRVIVNGVAYWGNSFSSNVSVTGGAEDLRNNLQSVFFPAGTFAVGDRVSIQVRGRTIAGDGVPNSGGAVDQDFALVAFNVAEENLVYPLVSTTVSDTLGTGNSNTNMEPGESGVRLAPTVENAGTSPLPISYIRLISTTPGVRVVQGLCVAPAMNPGQSFPLTATPFEIAVDSSIPCQTTVTLRSDFIDLGGNVVGQAPLTYVTGGAAPLNTTTRNNLALAISTGAPSSFEVPIAVSGSGIASRVDVRVRLTHTWISDIRLTLIGPDNTSVILANQVGGSGDNMTNTVFSDTASEGISSGTPPFTGTFRPTAPLSAFVGKSINGNWRLVVADVAQDDGGTFEDVELRFFTDGCTAASSSGVFYRSSVTDWSATGPFGVDLGGDNAFLSSRGLGSRTRNTAVGAIGLSVNAVANGGPNRIFGFLESETGALPYSSVGTNNFVRARYAVTYSGPGNSGSATTYNLVPNFRIRAGMRFVDTAIMEVLHNSGNTDPASKDIARELGPSIDPGAPSIYKVDYDPVDVPQVTSTDPAQAIQRGFETFVISPDYTYVNGTLLITDSSIGTYPRPDLSAVPTKLYAAGGSAGNSDFDNPSVFIVTASVSRAEAIAGAITEFRTPEPTLVGTKAPAGVTLNTSGIGNDRIGILAVDFLDGNNADRTNLAGRVRVAPDELYVVSFRFNSAGASNNHPYLRMRARSLKFQWAASLGIGGAKAVGSTQGQTLAAQALPGSGNQIPGAGLDGATYNLILPTPLDLSIRRDKLGTLAERFPTISAQPGPGVNSASVRDLKIGFDIVDSLSFASGQENEVANNTILNRVEVRKFTAPLD